MAKIKLLNIPDDVAIAVFGMDSEQWTVNGDPRCTYYNKSPDTTELEIDINPPSPRLLMRVEGRKLRWRTDKEFFNPETETYNPHWVAEWEEHLTIDPISRPDEPKEEAIVVVDASDYQPIEATAVDVRSHRKDDGSGLSDERKHIYAIIPKGNRTEVEHFRHSLPRALNWLLYAQLPIDSDHTSLTFFYYEFGSEQGISKRVLNGEPWRLDTSNNQKLLEARTLFAKKVEEWGGSILCLTTRELRKVSPVLHEANPLTIPEIILPGNVTPLWRYVDIPKFTDLLVSRSLWFARPSSFDDPFETKTNRKSRVRHLLKKMQRLVEDYNSAVHDRDVFYLNQNEWWAEDLVGEDGNIPPKKYANFSEIPHEFLLHAEQAHDEILDGILVNCWHKNDGENDGMWRAYTDSAHAIAVVTTFENLRASFRTQGYTPKIVDVEYNDLHDESVEFEHLPTLYKHIAFRYENETRAYLPTNLSKSAPGMSVPVDPKIMIAKVVLAPNSPAWLERNVRWLLDMNGLKSVPLEQSLFKKALY